MKMNMLVIAVVQTIYQLQRSSARVESVNLGMGMFVCLTSQVASFIDQMNENMACRTPGCNGTF